MSSQAIRAGRAFVEVVMKDEQVARQMADLKVKIRAMGATVAAVGSQSFTAMNAGATTALAATVTSSAVATAGASALSVAVRSVTAAFTGLFRVATGSVAGVAASFIGLGAAVKNFMPKNSPLRGMLAGLLDFSQAAELSGRRMKIFGGLVGSSFLSGAGRSLERAGMGGMIARAFNTNGISGALTASLGAAFRSARGMVASFAASAITAPFQAAFSLVNGTAATTAVQLTRVATSTNVAAASMARAAISTRGFAGALSSLAGAFSKVFRVAGVVGKIASAIAAAGAIAAGGFGSAAAEITAKAKETGKSIQSLINEKYGKFSFVTPADIAAGDAFSKTMKELKQQIAAAFAQLGIAAMPAMKKAAEFMIGLTQVVTRFMSENRNLIGTVVSVAGRIAKAYGAIAMAGLALPVIGAAVAALMNPTALLVGAVTAVAASFPQVRQAASDALGFVGSMFRSALQAATDFFNYLFPNASKVGSVFGGTISGVIEALQGGSLETAGRVAMAGIKLAWMEGTEKLREIYENVVASMQRAMADATLAIQIKWEETVVVMKKLWQGFTAIISASIEPITSALKPLKGLWDGIVSVATTFKNIVVRIGSTAMNVLHKSIEKIKPAWDSVVAHMKRAWEAVFGKFQETISKLLRMMPGANVGKVLRDAALGAIPGGAAVRIGIDAGLALNSDGAKKERADNQKTADDRIAALKDEHALRMKSAETWRAVDRMKAKDEKAKANEEFEEAKFQAERLAKIERLKQAGKDTEAAKKSNSSLASGFGSFSAATAGLQGVAGLGKMEELAEKTAKNTEDTVAAIKSIGGVSFA